jgi:hypothetical protein
VLTIFTIPKPFAGHIGIIQRNALASWRRLGPRVETILFGNDLGVKEAAAEFGARHEPALPANIYGTPLVSAAFAEARGRANGPFLMYANADMLFDDTLLRAVDIVMGRDALLMSGRRWDIDVVEDLVGAPEERWRDLFAQRTARGRLNGPSAMDYFIFPRTLDLCMPDLAVGRVGWDSWMIWRSRQLNVPVIDATAEVAALHQNHTYASLARGCQHHRGPERDLNIKQAGGLSHMLTLREADYCVFAGQLVRQVGWKNWRAALATWSPYLGALAVSRWLRTR